MQYWMRFTVLRVPAKTFGIWFEWDWEKFLEEYGDVMTWRPGEFGPGLFDDREHGYYLDYFLEKTELPGEDHTEHIECARPLTDDEKARYLPAFRKLSPQFSLREMEDVHYCRFVWNISRLGPFCY